VVPFGRDIVKKGKSPKEGKAFHRYEKKKKGAGGVKKRTQVTLKVIKKGKRTSLEKIT